MPSAYKYQEKSMKRSFAFFMFVASFLFLFLGCQFSHQTKIGYVVQNDELSAEDQAAVRWLKSQSQFAVNVLNAVKTPDALKKSEVLWLHIPDSLTYQQWTGNEQILQALKDIYTGGGKLFLTDYAALLPHKLGIEDQAPEVHLLDIKDDWLFDKKGFQSFRGHPLFAGLFGGAFIWDAYEDHKLPTVGFFGDNYPQAGKVVATEKSYITIHQDRKLVIEYDAAPGKIITAGGFVYFSKKNRVQYKLDKFVSNAFQYLAGNLTSDSTTYWNRYDCQPKEFKVATAALKPAAVRAVRQPTYPDLLLTRDSGTTNYYDVEGRRALIMGKENGGIDELWVHPFMVLRDYQAGIVIGDSVAWLKHMPVKIEVRPEAFTRIYATPVGELKEIVFPSLEKAGGVLNYQAATDHPFHLVIKFRSNLRWMWPYDQCAIGDVNYGYDAKLNALHLKDSAGNFYCVIGGDETPEAHLTGQYDDITWKQGAFTGSSSQLNQVYHVFEYPMNAQNNFILNFAIVGTNNGKREALDHYNYLLGDPQGEYDRGANHFLDLVQKSVTVESPDMEFNRLWKWAIIGTDRFWVNTPGLGTALVAGYATTARGWGGAQKISGRPGYAWYFGRDSEWSCFAIDGYGDFNSVKMQLEFLQKFQGLTGKIFHEISTSGVVHYDASDATPLYVILAAHYLRASGDIEFIKASWPHLKKAMDFLYSTDTDSDMLIENTNVGHGWVEGGKLWGAHTTLYLAALWARTLKDAAYLAEQAGKKELIGKYRSDAKKVKDIVNGDYWNDSTQFYNYGKMKDGSYNTERTIFPAVAMSFDVLDSNKTPNMLEKWAGNGFSADWGMRTLSSESPLFSPYGYHYGSIWPLFTGWGALAEYAYGDPVQGFSHILNNLYIKNNWELGFVEEVLRGDKYLATGVCPHQCWSETNILHPGIQGMIGWKPDAPAHLANLTPQLPLNWDKVTIHNLRVGNSVMQFTSDIGKNESRFAFHLVGGDPLHLQFNPHIPAGMVIDKIMVDGKDLAIATDSQGGASERISIPVEISGNHQVLIKHHKGIEALPVVTRPRPGDNAIGYRLLHTKLEGNTFTMEVEGKPGTGNEFRVMAFNQSVKSVRGAAVSSLDNRGVLGVTVSFPHSREAFVKKNITIELQ